MVAAAGAGKCLVASTWVASPQAGMWQIGVPPETVDSVSWTFDIPAGEVHTSAPAKWAYMGESPTYRVRTRSGIEIEGTPEHPLLIWDGAFTWVSLSELREGDHVLLVPGHALDAGSETIHPDEAYLAGLVAGNGTFTAAKGRAKMLSFCTGFEDLGERYAWYYQTFWGAAPTRYDSKGRVPQWKTTSVEQTTVPKARVPEVLCASARDKRFPALIAGASRAARIRFLQGLFDTDASVFRRQVEWVSASEQLARGVHQVLLGLGIVSTLRPKRVKKGSTNVTEHVYWRITITGLDLPLFAATVGFRHSKYKQAALSAIQSQLAQTNIGVPHVAARLRDLAESWREEGRLVGADRLDGVRIGDYLSGRRLPSPAQLRKLIGSATTPVARTLRILSGLRADAVTSIEFCSEPKPVYDFHVPNTHNFVANGVVSHNTETLARLVANLLAKRIVEPERLVATTFTNKGAGELRARIQKHAPLDLVNRAQIGTFHALALRRMQTLEPRHWPMARNIDLPGKSRSTDVPHAMVIWKAIVQYGKIPGSNKPSLKLADSDEAVRSYALAVNVLRAQGVDDPGDPRVAAIAGLTELPDAYAAFNEAKLKGKFWDFADVLAAYTRLVTSAPPSADVVIVDEAQDQTEIQLRIAQALGKHIVLVGDGSQVIYAWNGAYPELFLEADTKLGAATKHLSYNFRSVPEIVDLGNRIVRPYPWSLDHEMLPVHPSKGKGAIRVRRGGQKAEEEADWIAQDVKRKIERGATPGDITVLSRTNAHLFDIQAELTLRDVPTVVMGGQPLFTSREAMDVLCYLTLAKADGAGAFGALEHILDRPKRFIGKAGATRVREELVKVGSIRHALKNTCHTPEARKLSLLLDQLLRADWLTAVGLVEKLLVDGGKLRRENKDDPDEDTPGIYKAMCSIAKKFPGAREFIEFTDKCARGGNTEDPSDPAKVVLSTIHKYKGRENVHVYGPATEQVIPHGKVVTSDRHKLTGPDVEGELRLFYVACTRAKDTLTLTYWGSELENRGPSRFLRAFCATEMADPLAGYTADPDEDEDDGEDDPAGGGTGLTALLPAQNFLGGWDERTNAKIEALTGINPGGILK